MRRSILTTFFLSTALGFCVLACEGMDSKPSREGGANSLEPLGDDVGNTNTGLAATYFDNEDFSGATVERIDPVVDFDWGRGSPDPTIESDTFSVRWKGFVQADHSETYTFYTLSDDGIRLWVGGELVIENWTRHSPTENSGSIELEAGKRYPIKMEFFEHGGGAVAKLKWSSPSLTKQIVPQTHLFSKVGQEDLCPDDPEKTEPGVCGCGTPEGDCDSVHGLAATYFDTEDFSGAPIERIDPVVDFDWGRGSPDPAIEADTFSVRWKGFVQADHSETYTFYTVSDDGVRLWVGGKLVIENWTRHSPTENSGSIELEAGKRYPIKMEFFEHGGGAVAKLKWSSPSLTKQIVPEELLFNEESSDDLCPDDPDKTEPGACGCGTPDVDSNGNGTFDCNEECEEACAPDQRCGIIDDGCGGTIDCGVCGIGQVCENHRCVEDNPGYQCDIVCTGGKVLADYCGSPTTTSDEDACDRKRDLCCVDDMTPCPTLCGENKIFNDDVYLYWDDMTCGEYMDSLTPTDPACTNPLPHVPDACCSNSFPSSPPAAANPCYDLCGDDLQMVGSRVLDEHMMTCFDYARSTSADDAQCTSPDPSIVDRCCDTPRPLPKPVANYCCLCDGCYGTLSDRYYHKIGPDALTCVEMDYRITVDHKYGDAECSAKQEAFSATCCDANFDPPPEVPGEDEDSGQPNRCNVPDPPSYCTGIYPRCEICLDGSFPKKPYTVWTIAGVPGNPTCADLYWAGNYGGLPQAYCYPIRNKAQESCGCQ